MTKMEKDAVTTLFILNDAPYGSERSYNGLRLAGTLSKAEGEEVKMFLLGDAASCAKRGQKVADGFYNMQLMLGRVVRNKAKWACAETARDPGVRCRRWRWHRPDARHALDAPSFFDDAVLHRCEGGQPRIGKY
jgi:sulfur relay (sulfurtransferase) complex TusBCD TusD component (DsrE family)